MAAWPESLTPTERVERARLLVSRLIDDLREVLALSAANRHIIYSPLLASQIPESYAANAFNLFQWSSLNFEILRVCSLWDEAARDRASIPTVARLVDHPDCLRLIETDLQRGEFDPRYAPRHMSKLSRALRVAKVVKAARFTRALYDFRNERLAHTLLMNSTSAPRSMPKYGYERRLLRASVAIVEGFNNSVRNSSFAFDDAIEQFDGHAEALWKGCVFKVLR